jgi:hypothetical protein
MKILFVMLTLSLAIIISCDENGSIPEAVELMGETHTAEDEESNVQYAKDGTHDEVRRGARLILSYDSTTKSFSGTVENTTDAVLNQVRVEVHLSNGVELGPTTPQNLQPNEKIVVELSASGQDFVTWSAHAEVG